MQSRKWTDNQGPEKTTTEIVLQNYNSTLQILDSRERGSSSEGHSGSNSHHKKSSSRDDISVEENDDEVPF